MKKYGVLLLVAAMLLSFSGCCVSTSDNEMTIPPWIDFEAAQENFVADWFSTVSMEVGEKTDTISSAWLSLPTLGGWLCGAASSDESVVTVAQNGTITAVGPGTAYVIYWELFMSKTYLVTVEQEPMLLGDERFMPRVEAALSSGDIDETFTLFTGEVVDEYDYYFTDNEFVYIEDESVAGISSDGTITALREGSTKVVRLFTNSWDDERDYVYEIVVKNNDPDARMQQAIDEYSVGDGPKWVLFAGEVSAKHLSEGSEVMVQDESIISVENGCITAHKPGVTYAVVLQNTHGITCDNAYQVVVRDVTDVMETFKDKIENYDYISSFNTEEMTMVLGESMMFAEETYEHLVIQDETVVQANPYGAITAVGKGTTYMMKFDNEGDFGGIYIVTVK